MLKIDFQNFWSAPEQIAIQMKAEALVQVQTKKIATPQ
jgi:hypothetical protein